MSIDNIQGLEFYTKYLTTKKELFPKPYRTNPFSNIRSIKAIPYLMKLLKLSYDKNLKEDRFDSLYRIVENILINIALKNEKSFRLVVKSVNGFIDKNKASNNEVNFLYTYLERLERQFYFSKSKNITINDVLSKLKTITFPNS